MKIVWTDEAKRKLSQIYSKHFDKKETEKYKKELVIRINDKVTQLMTTVPSKVPRWKGHYEVLVDKYWVYYKFSENSKICYIESFVHTAQSYDR